MKTLLALLLFIAPHAHSTELGFFGGLGQTSAHGDNVDSDVKDDLSYRLGPVMRFDASEDIYFRLGLTYTLRGYEVRGVNEDTGDFDTYDVKLGYLDVPLLAGYQINHWLSVLVGPTIAFNLNAKAQGTQAGGRLDIDLKDIAESPLVFAHLGLNFHTEWLGVELFYEKGLSDVFEDDNSQLDVLGANLLFWFSSSDRGREHKSQPYRYQRSRSRN